jgi:hypothetical protein
MQEHDLDLRNVERAREQYRKVAKLAGALQETLPPPTAEEREDLKQCIYAGLVTSIYKYNGNGTYVHVGNPETPRQISNRSLVRGAPQALVGTPYRVTLTKGGEKIERHVIEGVTAATLVDLGRVATHLTTWRSEGLRLRGGKFVDVQRLRLFDIDLGITEEVVAEPSPKLRETVIAHALENAGSQQHKLRALKKELEKLSHLAKAPIPRITHDQMVDLVREAAPEDITDPSVIDNNLRIIMEERGITLDAFVSAERQAGIIANAPAEIDAEGITLHVAYQKSCPLVRHFDPHAIAKLHNDIFLADGRQVYFVHQGKRWSLVELQAKLGIS